MPPAPNYEQASLRKGPWTAEEDQQLVTYITRYGTWNWRNLPKFAGLLRTGKSCRLRWMNYLNPNINRTNFTREEEELIIRLHERLGNRWSAIAHQLPGRIDDDIKNYWRDCLKKRAMPRTQLRGYPTFMFDDYNAVSKFQSDTSRSASSTPQLSYSTSSTKTSIWSVSTVCSSTDFVHVEPQMQHRWLLFKPELLVLFVFLVILVSVIALLA